MYPTERFFGSNLKKICCQARNCALNFSYKCLLSFPRIATWFCRLTYGKMKTIIVAFLTMLFSSNVICKCVYLVSELLVNKILHFLQAFTVISDLQWKGCKWCCDNNKMLEKKNKWNYRRSRDSREKIQSFPFFLVTLRSRDKSSCRRLGPTGYSCVQAYVFSGCARCSLGVPQLL